MTAAKKAGAESSTPAEKQPKKTAETSAAKKAATAESDTPIRAGGHIDRLDGRGWVPEEEE